MYLYRGVLLHVGKSDPFYYYITGVTIKKKKIIITYCYTSIINKISFCTFSKINSQDYFSVNRYDVLCLFIHIQE